MRRPRNFEPDTVIGQAMETFWTNSYANTSPADLADLAEATGLTKGSLYGAANIHGADHVIDGGTLKAA